MNECLLQSIPVATVLMEMFVWWEAPISMRGGWRCASMTSGGQCVMTTGTAPMLQLSANNWGTLEVRMIITVYIDVSEMLHFIKCCNL